MPTTLADLLAAHHLLPVAWQAAELAGAFLAYERPDDLVVESKSSPVDAVTEMDRGAEERIVAVLRQARPDDGILGEEGGERAGTSGVRWVVDPLDGTVNYLYRQPAWAVSVAAEVDGVAEVGVIVAPAYGEAYLAARGMGAWRIVDREATRMRVGRCASMSMALVATGFGYRAEVRREQAQVVAGLLDQVRDIRRIGAATLDLVGLAGGRLDGYYERGLNRWDLAAGALVAQEAGAVVGSVESDDMHTGTFIGAVPSIYDELRSALRTLGSR